MEYRIEIRDVARDDLERVPKNIRVHILRAVERRLLAAPTHYGLKLRKGLEGLWKMRVGDYRVIYEIRGHRVIIWAMLNLRSVYSEVQRRWFRSDSS